MSDAPRTQAIVAKLCKQFIERSEHLNYKGKKRDDFALEYFVGACATAEAVGDVDLSKHLSAFMALSVAVRGYIAVARFAKDNG